MSELRVDNIVSQDGSAAPIYSKGIRIAVGQTLTNDGDFVVGGATSISGSLRVTGGSINVTGGITTLGGQVNINNFNVTGVATFSSPLNVSNATFTGVTTYSGRANFNSGITVTGGSNVSGVATFANVTNFSAGIDVTGHTELDNVNSSGVVTATSFHTGAEGSAIRVTSNTISGPAEMFIDPAAVGDNTGALRIKGDLYVDGTQTYINSTTLEVADYNVGIATTVGTNIVLDGAGIGIGSTGIRKTFNYNNTANTLESSIGLGVTSGGSFKTGSTTVLTSTTLGSGVVNSSLTSVGTLGQVNVSGASTFGTVRINTGIVTATSGIVTYYGDGSQLTGTASPPADGQDFNTGITSALSTTLTGLGATVLTLPSTAGKQYIVYSIHASNVAVGNTEVNVIGAFDYTGGERVYFGYNIPIPTGTAIEMLKQPHILNPSDRITMRSTDYNRAGIDTGVEVYITYQEKTSSDYFGVGLGTVGIAVTDPTTIHTATTYPSIIESINLTNRTDTGSYPVSITVTSGIVTTYLVDNLLIPKYGSVEILDTPKRLNVNDVLSIQVDQTSTIDVQVSGKKVV
jgi:hypothetical protein